MWLAGERGFRVANADATIMLEKPKLREYILAMRENLARTMTIEVGCISVKAKTGEGLDAIGRKEAVSVQAVVLLESRNLESSRKEIV